MSVALSAGTNHIYDFYVQIHLSNALVVLPDRCSSPACAQSPLLFKKKPTNQGVRVGFKPLMCVFREAAWNPQLVTSQLIILSVTVITPFHLPPILLPSNPLVSRSLVSDNNNIQLSAVMIVAIFLFSVFHGHLYKPADCAIQEIRFANKQLIT